MIPHSPHVVVPADQHQAVYVFVSGEPVGAEAVARDCLHHRTAIKASIFLGFAV
jgi:hypothetical protein